MGPQWHTVFGRLDWTGLDWTGLVKRGLVKWGLNGNRSSPVQSSVRNTVCRKAKQKFDMARRSRTESPLNVHVMLTFIICRSYEWACSKFFNTAPCL